MNTAFTGSRPARTIRNMPSKKPAPNAEAQLASFFARYEPPIAKLGKALRAKLRARLPGLSEVVYMYENQHSLVISYSPTGNGYDGLCGLSLYPGWAHLFFGQGAVLAKSDPDKLLQGHGKTVRHVVLKTVADFDRPQVEALMAAALTLAKLRLDPRAKGAVIIKAEEQKQRALKAAAKKQPVRRATKAAPPAATPRKPKAPR